MKPIIYLALMACFLTSAVSIEAEDSGLPARLMSIVETMPEVAVAKNDVIVASMNVANAVKKRGPSLTGGASIRQDFDASSASSQGLSLSVSQGLFPNLFSSPTVDLANAGLDSAIATLGLEKVSAYDRLATAYITAWNASQLVDIAIEIKRRRQASVDLIRARFEAGREPRGSLTWAIAQADQAVIDCTIAKRNREIAVQEYRILAGTTDGLFPISDVAQWLDTSALNNQPTFHTEIPSIKLKMAGWAAAIAQRRLHALVYGPQVTVGATSSLTNTSQMNPQWSQSVSVGLTVPLFSNGVHETALNQLDIAVETARLEVASATRNKRADILEAWARFKNAMDGLIAHDALSKAAKERSELAEAQYNAGLISYDNWDVIETQTITILKQTQSVRFEAVAAKLSVQIAMEHLMCNDN